MLPAVVVDPAETYRRGLAGALREAGFAPEEPPGVRGWAASPGQRAILWTMRSPCDWKTLTSLKDLNSELVVVALLVEATPDGYAEALRCGANTAVQWEDSPENIVGVLKGAVESKTILPTRVAWLLAQKVPTTRYTDLLTDGETSCLRMLARGSTVHELSEKVGYSERALYRMLQALYEKMGVNTRTEAIVEASRSGLLD